MEYKIGLIASYKELADEATKLSHKNGFSIVIHTAEANQAYIAAKQLEENNINVIIVREATEAYLNNYNNLPLVTIPISTTDILKTILKAKKTSKDFILFNYKGYYENISFLEETANCQIDQIVYYSKKDAMNKMKKLSINSRVIIGNEEITAIANKNGISSYLIESCHESIRNTLKIAHRIAIHKVQAKRKFEYISTILNQTNDGIVAIDKIKNITIFNDKAERIFEINLSVGDKYDKEYVLETTFLSNVLLTKIPINERTIKIYNKDYIISTVPLLNNNDIYGCVSILKDVSIVQKTEYNIRLNLHNKGLTAKFKFEDIIGTTNIINKAINKAKKFACSPFNILITGDTGTGKEMFAQSIHNFSDRRHGPFVAVNCAAIPESLLESELFGYDEGAFTGAKKGGKPGLFELAHNGTIFLDEIGDLPLSLQAHLLRIIQEKEVVRIGGKEIIPINVKIITCTNVNLFEKVSQGLFREDLFYRLNVLHLHLPPLCERKEDIPIIALYILKKYNVKDCYTKTIITALDKVSGGNWKGNVRELENILAKFSVLIENENIDNDNTIKEILNFYPGDNKNPQTRITETSNLTKSEFYISNIKTEKEILTELIGKGLSKTKIAELLGISRTTLWRKIKKHQLF